MTKIQELREKRATYAETAEKILQNAKTGGRRDLTAAEAKDVEGLEEKMLAVTRELDAIHAETVAYSEAHPGDNNPLAGYYSDWNGGRKLSPSDGVCPGKFLRPKDSFARAMEALGLGQGERDLDLGKIIRGQYNGNWRGADAEREAMKDTRVNGTGFPLPTLVSSGIIDVARAQSVSIQAGAQTYPMDARTVKLARAVTDAVPQWRAENAAITEGTPTFEGVTLTAKSLACIAKVSVELIEDAENLGKVLLQMMGEAIGLEMDRAGLLGSGADEQPKGITLTTDVGSVPLNLAANNVISSFDPLLAAVRTCAGYNLKPNAAVMHPDTLYGLDGLKDTTHQPLQPPAKVAELQMLSTTSIPTDLTVGDNEDCSLIIVGKFDELLYGIKGPLVVDISRSAADSVSSSFSQMQVWLRVYIRLDVAVMRPRAFTVVSGVRL